MNLYIFFPLEILYCQRWFFIVWNVLRWQVIKFQNFLFLPRTSLFKFTLPRVKKIIKSLVFIISQNGEFKSMKNFSCMFSVIILTFFSSGTSGASDYYVSNKGADSNTGSKNYPFQTIQKASDVMGPGDVCYVRGGVYRETVRPAKSGTAGAPILFTNYPGEHAYITGTQRINVWDSYSGGIYNSSVGQTVMQVFVGWKQMIPARFPNATSDNMMTTALGTADAATGNESYVYSTITDDIIGSSGIDFTGAELWLLGGRKWVAFSATIGKQNGSTLSFLWNQGTVYAYVPSAGSSYFITGTLKALDTEKEWFYDKTTGKLYLRAPGSVDPSSLDVEAQVRKYGFDLSGSSYIEIKGIDFFAANVSFNNANSCILDNALVTYPAGYFPADGFNRDSQNFTAWTGLGIALGGTGNIVRNCEICNSWGDGVSVYGVGNTVENCLIHDVDWSVTDCAGLNTGGSGHILHGNSIYNTARGGIVHRVTTGLRIERNIIYNYGVLSTDLGGTYAYETDGGGSIIAYNYIHNQAGREFAGIYLDTACKNYTVHHNVVWDCTNGLLINITSINNLIFNNTFWHCTMDMTGITEPGPLKYVLENQKLYNNIFSDTGKFFGTDVKNNLAIRDAGFVDPDNGNFSLKSTSKAIDYGLVIPGITDGFVGNAPDAGAYEYGGDIWKPGSNLSPRPEPAPVEGSETSAVNETRPHSFALEQNYPNPFNPSTQIRYQIPESAKVQIAVYDLLGQRVRLIVNDHFAQGSYEVVWNGLDEKGGQVSSGIYLYRMTAQGNQIRYVKNGKMLLMR
jgi:hypothetical protein